MNAKCAVRRKHLCTFYRHWHVDTNCCLDERVSFASPALRNPGFNGPPASLNGRSAFALARYLRPHLSITSLLPSANVAMPARTVFAEARHFLGVGSKAESPCRLSLS